MKIQLKHLFSYNFIYSITRRLNIFIDKIKGLDFLAVIKPEEVGLDSTISFRSSPSGDKYLEHLLSDFKITSNDSLIDIGCGKGSALKTILKFPFGQIDGIELSEQIANIAKRNFTILNTKRVKIFNCDAIYFKDYDSYNYFYLYNPFPCFVMVDVIAAIEKSIINYDREVIIIYNNPMCNEIILKNEIFKKNGYYPDKWGNMIYIYSNRQIENSILKNNMKLNQ